MEEDMAGSDIFTGTLEVLCLKALSGGPLHGYGVGLWLRQTSGEILNISEGVLYPALHRLAKKGLVKARWDSTETGRRAKFYRLTEQGRRYLAEETERLAEHSEAVLAVLKA
jgi:transcriptional regulator